jgi:putative hydrolase of the HAD superfamily
MKCEIKVLSFDLDDTLWLNAPTIKRAEELLFQWLTDHVPQITQRYDLLQLREKRFTLLSERPELAHNLTQLRMMSFEQLAVELNLSTGWIEPAFEIFYEARQQVTLYDDVKPVLDELSQRYLLVSLTNGNADTVKTGIDHWFDLALSSETVGKLKSDPDFYRHALELADVIAQQMVHIGDSPENDIAGAKSAGIFAIWLNRDGKQWPLESCQPDRVITGLHELPELLTAL